ncbi:uncharacterized protein LOC143032604 [Oratosquilla oratoria]|uniref:uncharacterized protein LOC143032604 n=1 Tax=Oratosquilla oratoria TaxID=337810 RepID=UPI003F769894
MTEGRPSDGSMGALGVIKGPRRMALHLLLMVTTLLLRLDIIETQAICPVPLATMNMDEVENLAVYTCISNYKWNTNSRVEILTCTDGILLQGPQCVLDSNPSIPTCNGIPEVPENAEIVREFPGNLTIFRCQADLKWVSGETLRFSECFAGNWTFINDICIQDNQSAPRTCEDVANIGHNDSHRYYIFPTGNYHDTPIKTSCELETHSCTYVFEYNTGDQFFRTDMNSFKTGIKDGNENAHWIGLDVLHNLTYSNDTGPYVITFYFKKENGEMQFASYDNFVVGPSPNYRLESVGNYYGDAGDSLSIQVGKDFWCSIESYCFWSNSTDYDQAFPTYHGKWDPLSPDYRYEVKACMRSARYDKEVACPNSISYRRTGEMESDVTFTSSSGHQFREEGDTVTWSCKHDLYKVPLNDGSFNKTGTAQCQKLENGTLAWSAIPSLPCQLHCPEGMEKGNDRYSCFNFSSNTARGIVGAASKCAHEGMTLATLSNYLDVKGGEEGIYYLTAHTNRKWTVIKPAWPNNTNSGFWCNNTNSTCEETSEENCVFVYKSGEYFLGDCDQRSHYICELKGECPQNYELVNGLCLRRQIDTNDISFIEHLEKCAADGGSFFWPTSKQQITGIYEKYSSVNKIRLGIHKRTGNWTLEGYYEPDADLIQMLEDQDFEFFEAIGTVEGFNLTERDNDFRKTECQHPGIYWCEPPPPPPENGYYDWNGTRKSITETVNYSCYPGYFFSPNDTTAIARELQCITQAGYKGGWDSVNPLECTAIEVCGGVPNITSEGMQMEENETSSWLNGTVIYTCPETMSTIEGLTNQTLRCNKSPDSNAYEFQPQKPKGCIRCAEPPEILINYSSYIWTSQDDYTIDDIIEIQCNTNHEYELGKNTQNVTCEAQGWSTDHLQPCLPVCSDDPPPGVNITQSNMTTNEVGTVLTYSCPPGYFLPITQEEPNITQAVEVECNDNHTWVSPRDDLMCLPACAMDLPNVPANASRDWDGFSRNENLIVTYSCDEGMAFPNATANVSFTCLEGNWTGVDQEFLNCMELCSTGPPEGPDRTTSDWDEETRWVNTEVTFTCNDNRTDLNGTNSTSTICNGTDWVSFDEDFECVDLCKDPIPSNPIGGMNDFTGDRLWGATLNFSCPGTEFVNGDEVVTVECLNGTWTPSTFPLCRLCLEPPPKTPDDGSWNFNGVRLFNTSIQYTCPGSVFQTNKAEVIVTCEEIDGEGTWIPGDVPLCKKIGLCNPFNF